MTHRWQRAALPFAIVAMLLRALIPTGWMPNPQGVSETAFIICGMDGLVMPGMDMSQMAGMDVSNMDVSKSADSDPEQPAPARHSDDGRQHEACPFAAAPHIAAPLLVAHLLASDLTARTADILDHAEISGRLPDYEPHSPRAPPQIA